MFRSRSMRRVLRPLGACAVSLALAVSAAACGGGSSDDSSSSGGGKTAQTVVLGWYADPEGGGYYAAQVEGLYEKAGLDVTIQPGGPQVSSTDLVAAGRAQFGHTDAAGIIQAQQQGIPIVAIAALYQDNPVGILSHKDQNITSFDQMQGKTLVSQSGALYPIYLDKKLGIKMPTRQYQGSIAAFLKDDSLLQQGWPTNEVRQAEEAGVPVNFMPYSESGFNPYNDVVFTSKDYLAKHRDDVVAFLKASIQGWSDYLSNVDVATKTNAELLKANDQQSSTSVWYAWDVQRKFLVAGDGAKQLGAMSEQRWTTLIEQMGELDQLKSTPKTSDLYDASVLPTIPGPTSLPPKPANVG